MKAYKLKQGEKILLIKVTLRDEFGRAKGSPSRTLAIPEEFTLHDLAEAIVESFDFDFDHAFGFYDNTENWIDSEEGYELFSDMGEESKFKGVKRTKVGKVFNKIGKKMLFLFDYGDEWHFILELKKIEQAKEKIRYPSVVESIGEAPSQYGEEF